MEKYRKWKLKVGMIDPNDEKWSKREAELLDSVCSKLAMKAPAVCEIIDEGPFGIYAYNYNDGAQSLTLRPNQCKKRHEYHSSPAVWFMPECKDCADEFEHQVGVDPKRWRKRSEVDDGKLFGGKAK